MPSSTAFPFRRLWADHMIAGVSRIAWQLSENFNDPFPHIFQLQAGMTGLDNATDWVDVGGPVTNVWTASDDVKRLNGKILYTHYRVILTTPIARYVSGPEPVFGLLQEQDWVTSREIVRKEVLRGKLIGREGVLLKRIRFGIRCPRCLDPLTKTPTDPNCPVCLGSGFSNGFHAPVNLPCWDLSPLTLNEMKNATTPPGQQMDAMVKARVLGFPDLAKEDVWVDAASDQRWFIDTIEQQMIIRGVPIVLGVTMQLAEFTNEVYRIPIGGETTENPDLTTPTIGTGCVTVDQDYPSPGALLLQNAAGCGLAGVTITAFLASDYVGIGTDPILAKGVTATGADGRWTFALNLDPGSYILLCEKIGSFGPDAFPVTVSAPDAGTYRIKMPAPPPKAAARGFGDF